jgi:hypothetical protein
MRLQDWLCSPVEKEMVLLIYFVLLADAIAATSVNCIVLHSQQNRKIAAQK